MSSRSNTPKQSQRTLILACLLVAGTFTAMGGAITLTLDGNYPKDYLSYTYQSASGTVTNPAVGPYITSMTGAGYQSSQVYYTWCFDYNIETTVGAGISGSLKAPTTAAEIEAAYLENQVLQFGGYSAGGSADGAYAMAIWQLMNPSSYNPAAFQYDLAAAPLIAQAQTAYANGTWTASKASAFTIFIPDSASSSQRFGLVAAPEPFSMLLVGAGLVAISAGRAVSRKRSR